MNELINQPKADPQIIEEPEKIELTKQNILEIHGEWIRKKYLSRLTEMYIADLKSYLPKAVKENANKTLELAKQYVPDKVEDVRFALNQFARTNNLPYTV